MHRRCYPLLVALLLILPVAATHAQGSWQEQRTLLFSILYPSGAEATAQQYAQFVDGIYDESSAFWGYRPATPIVLRLYPSMDLYYQANPLAAKIPGVIAHAHTGRREISVAIPQTAGQTEEEIHNNVRHELTHIIAADLSGGRLTTMWQEGIAQYVEHPSEQLDRKMELMRQIIAARRLLSWADLNQPGVAYSDPRVGYPESLTIVAFLVGRSGMERYRAFVEATKTASGYRGALEATYGVSADTLEREWLKQLPGYVNGGYRTPAGAPNGRGPLDLAAPEQMIARGDYAAAARTLQSMIAGGTAASDAESLQRAQSLLERAKIGADATQRSTDAYQALTHGDYETARDSGRLAQQRWEALGQSSQAAVSGQYAELAERGIQAQTEIEEAGTRLRQLQLRGAEERLISAYTTFGQLGDEPRASQARAAMALITRGEHILAVTCLLCGGLLVAWSVRRRRAERAVALPFT